MYPIKIPEFNKPGDSNKMIQHQSTASNIPVMSRKSTMRATTKDENTTPTNESGSSFSRSQTVNVTQPIKIINNNTSTTNNNFTNINTNNTTSNTNTQHLTSSTSQINSSSSSLSGVGTKMNKIFSLRQPPPSTPTTTTPTPTPIVSSSTTTTNTTNNNNNTHTNLKPQVSNESLVFTVNTNCIIMGSNKNLVSYKCASDIPKYGIDAPETEELEDVMFVAALFARHHNHKYIAIMLCKN